MSLYFVYTTGNSGVISPVLLLYRKLALTAQIHTICSIQYQKYFIHSNAAGNAERYSILRYLQANFRGGRSRRCFWPEIEAHTAISKNVVQKNQKAHKPRLQGNMGIFETS